MEGKWVWWWKDWIDRRFMDKFSDLPDVEEMMKTMTERSNHRNDTVVNAYIQSKGRDVVDAFTAHPMRCGGCGAKVGSTTLSRVLADVYQRQVERAQQLGYDPPQPIEHDDAAVLPLPPNAAGGATIQTIDYFRELVTDTYLFGRIAAVHALSDIHAMGAKPLAALVLAVAPFAADEQVTESTLLQLLGGVSDILQDEGVQLIGGHTCEGLELACGLSVTGYTEHPERLIRKRGGKVGDRLVLTKPIGTGALFAADMRGKCRGEFLVEALEMVSTSSGRAGNVASRFDGIHACTDVTGFGLVGHLLEMIAANDGDPSLPSIGAVLRIKNIPFLRGGLEASCNGIFSSLQAQNSRNRRAIVNHSDAAQAFKIEYPLLFDPQTAGGLLFFVDAEECDEFILLLRAEKISASVIGELEAFSSKDGDGSVCKSGARDSATGQCIRIDW
jgi:selenide, water dikinase